MKALALILIALSFQAHADESSGVDTVSLTCASADKKIQVIYNSGGGENEDDRRQIPLTIKFGDKKAQPALEVYFDSRNTYVDNTETSEIHEARNMFEEGMTSAHVYDDKAQVYTAFNQRIVLKPSARMTDLSAEARSFTQGRYSQLGMTMEIGGKKTVLLKCRAHMRSYGS